MSTSEAPAGPLHYTGRPATTLSTQPTNLAELLERILDKGIVIAGDISVSLVDVELLTIKLRLLIASVDKAREMGVDWWQSDPWLSSRAAEQQGAGNGDRSDSVEPERRDELLERLDRLEAAIGRLVPDGELQSGGEQEDRRR